MSDWRPPESLTRGEVVATSDELLASPEGGFEEYEDVFRISEVGLDWDIGVMVYEPPSDETAATPNGTPVGVFLLHGGSQDFRSMEAFARLIAGRLRYKVVSMTYPGRLYLPSPDRIWPGDTINPDVATDTHLGRIEQSADLQLMFQRPLASRSLFTGQH